MSDLVFLDTNVLIYARTHQDPKKQATAREWIELAVENDSVVLNRQILNELTWWILRKELRRSTEEIRSEIDALEAWGAEPVSESDVEVAWAIRAATGFQWYDCLLLAAAQRSECRIFLSEDMTDGLRIGGVTIINPFKHHPEDFLRRD